MPKNHLLDNEASLQLKAAMTKKQIKYHLFPPQIYLRNADELAIRTLENISHLVWKVLIPSSLNLNGIISPHKPSLL